MNYTRTNPSPRYQPLLAQYRDMHEHGDRLNNIPAEATFNGTSVIRHVSGIQYLIDKFGAKTLLDYGCGKATAYDDLMVTTRDRGQVKGLKSAWGLERVALYDPGYEKHSSRPSGLYDGVISTDMLEHCPEEDIDWIVSDIFSFCRLFVFCSIAIFPAGKLLPTGENAHITVKNAGWWVDKFEEARHQHKGRNYFLAIVRPDYKVLLIEG